MTDFAGKWFTSFGPMSLTQNGSSVTGSYGRGEPKSTVSGTVSGRRLTFEYAESREHGTGFFDLKRDGRFVGEYTAKGTTRALSWTGNRGFDGIWSTSLGTMRLVASGNRVQGRLDHGPPFDGEVRDGRLVFPDFVAGTKGDATLELTGDDFELRGQWTAADPSAGGFDFSGFRQLPEPRASWLIVLEAHWQRSLAEREFAFGDMLDEIFARLPHVNVRHRYFDNEESLLHWCAALQFLPEPVVLVVTSHGEPEGISVRGKIIDSRRIIETLQSSDSLRLVHFSSCLIAKNGGAGLANPDFPVSGYTSSVDWMASALTEFTYLDMILAKGLTPEAAAEQVYRLIGFSGDQVAADCPYPAAGFQLVPRTPAGALPDKPTETLMAGAATGGTFGLLGGLRDLRDKLTGRN